MYIILHLADIIVQAVTHLSVSIAFRTYFSRFYV